MLTMARRTSVRVFGGSIISRFLAACVAASFAALLAGQARAADQVAVSGLVKYDGPAPKVTFIKMDADKKCKEIHGNTKVSHEEEVVGAGGEVANVFVYVKEGVKGGPTPPPSTPAEINQKGCMYSPRVQGMIAGQKLNIVNSDDGVTHNIRCFAKNNKTFNIGQQGVGTRSKDFPKAENAIKFKCDVHPWMFAYIFVMDHPYYAVTGKDGKFEIKGLPAGEYTVAAWHEKYGEQEMKIKVGGEGAAKADFTFKPAK